MAQVWDVLLAVLSDLGCEGGAYWGGTGSRGSGSLQPDTGHRWDSGTGAHGHQPSDTLEPPEAAGPGPPTGTRMRVRPGPQGVSSWTEAPLRTSVLLDSSWSSGRHSRA